MTTVRTAALRAQTPGGDYLAWYQEIINRWHVDSNLAPLIEGQGNEDRSNC